MTGEIQLDRSTRFLWISLLIAVIAVAGSLWLSLGMQLKACPLCFYQRSFAMAVMGVLLMGMWAGIRPVLTLGLIALPLATTGFGVACFHVYLEVTGKLECPMGILGWGSAPAQSATCLGLLFCTLLASVLIRSPDPKVNHGSVMFKAVVGFLLGASLAWAACKSVPPMPPTPTKPYAQPPDICRPPFND